MYSTCWRQMWPRDDLRVCAPPGFPPGFPSADSRCLQVGVGSLTPPLWGCPPGAEGGGSHQSRVLQAEGGGGSTTDVLMCPYSESCYCLKERRYIQSPGLEVFVGIYISYL